MDTFNFRHDIRVEKANAILRYRRIQRITTLFRVAELLVFLVIVSRFFGQFAVSLRPSGEYFRGISVTLISPRFVFLVGNAIVIVLFLNSGRFNGNKVTDFYEEYVESCRKNQEEFEKEEAKASDASRHKRGASFEKRKIIRCHSENLERTAPREKPRRELRRNMTERACRKDLDSGRKAAVGGNGHHCSYAVEEMSSEEFRRKVEAFIARQQRFLREEEEFPAADS